MHIALDLFAGAGGWDVAARDLGHDAWGVENMPEARETRARNGLLSMNEADVWNLESMPDWHFDTLLASPPCQAFSLAGAGSGRRALSDVLAALDDGLPNDIARLHEYADTLGDERIGLVLTPMSYVHQHYPQYIAFEQVPPVLPVWEAMAIQLERLGYSTWTGIVSAEQYAVPQVRKRAILIATTEHEVHAPTPTHSRFYARTPDKLDAGLQRWRTMADALGWGMTHRPYPTIASGRTTGGPDREKVGGSGARQNIYDEYEAGRWAFARPATTVAADPRLAGPGRSEFVKGGVSRQDRPGSFVLELEEAAALQSFPEDFAFAGGKGKKFAQIGNAVPPLLARAVLSEMWGEGDR